MLSCIYWGALFGGAITSVLFNIPGEPWSVATTFDGYPLAQQGKAATALTAASSNSATRRGVPMTGTSPASEAKRNGKDADNIAPGFRISGLGQLIEAGIEADRLVVFGGGVPINSAGALAGSVGVSGGSSEQDRAIAEAGATLIS